MQPADSGRNVTAEEQVPTHGHDHSDHSHGHGHSHGPVATLTTTRMRWLLGGIVVLVTLAAVIGGVLLRPAGDRPVLVQELGFAGELVEATVTSVNDRPCSGTVESDGVRCDRYAIDVRTGPSRGDRGAFEIPITEASPQIQAGDRIVVQYLPENPSELRYFFDDFERSQPLALLGLLFAIAVVLLGRWQGVRALLALGVTGVILIGFAFPSIIDGHNPTAVALVVAVLVAVVALYLTHGVTEMVTVALLGTFAALALTAVLAVLFTHLARFTGFSSEDAFYLQFASADIDIKGLILAGIIVGSLGVLDDVTVTQASAVWQLHEANPSYSVLQIYRSAVRIGRDHIASTVNTLVLAYAGASLPLLLLFAQAGQSLSRVATGELIAVEIVRTLVGSIGLVAAVPITTGLAAIVVTTGSAIRPTLPPEPASTERPSGTARRIGSRRPRPAEKLDPGTPRPSWDQFAPDQRPD